MKSHLVAGDNKEEGASMHKWSGLGILGLRGLITMAKRSKLMRILGW